MRSSFEPEKDPVPDETPPEINAAARTFSVGAPQFKNQVNQLSMKSIKRLLIALIEFGLHDKDHELLQPTEVPVFQLGMELLEAKAMMMEYAFKQEHEKQMKKAETAVQPAEGQKNEQSGNSESSTGSVSGS